MCLCVFRHKVVVGILVSLALILGLHVSGATTDPFVNLGRSYTCTLEATKGFVINYDPLCV